MTETVCDLDWVRADYERADSEAESPPAQFRITVSIPTDDPHTFIVRQNDGEQFAAELDVLAALIRAKVMRARLTGWAAASHAAKA